MLVLFKKRHGEILFLLKNFDQQDEMQLFAKLKQILYMGFRATLNFGKFKEALNPFRRIFETLQKVASYHANYNSIIKNGGHRVSF